MTAQPDTPAGIGHNRGPQTPYEAARERIEMLFEEAGHWLDGQTIEDQETADDLSNLLNMIRQAKKEVDEARKAEKKPLDDAVKEIQDRYNPLLKKADLAADTAKKALQPWLDEMDRRQREAAEAARREAEEKQRAAQEAMRASREAADLDAREEAERLAEEARQAERAASKADKARANASGGVGKAAALRTSYRAQITDETAWARFCWQHHREEMMELLQSLADRAAREKRHGLPGIEIVTERKVA